MQGKALSGSGSGSGKDEPSAAAGTAQREHERSPPGQGQAWRPSGVHHAGWSAVLTAPSATGAWPAASAVSLRRF